MHFIVGLSLRGVGLRKTVRWLKAITPQRQGDEVSDASVQDVVAHFESGLSERPLIYMQCLANAVTLTWLLARRGVPAEIVVGVRKDINFSAHAWVETRGRVLLDSDSVLFDYARLHSLRLIG